MVRAATLSELKTGVQIFWLIQPLPPFGQLHRALRTQARTKACGPQQPIARLQPDR